MEELHKRLARKWQFTNQADVVVPVSFEGVTPQKQSPGPKPRRRQTKDQVGILPMGELSRTPRNLSPSFSQDSKIALREGFKTQREKRVFLHDIICHFNKPSPSEQRN
jgi:hypothetical protein